MLVGARPLWRVTKRLENPLACSPLSGDPGSANEVYVDGDQQALNIATSDEPQGDENLVVTSRKAS